MKKIFLTLGLLWSAVANAQFTPGQLLTAAELNTQFSLYAPLTGATFTGPINLFNASLPATGRLGYDTTPWSPYELEMSINAGGNNVLHLTNNNNNGFSAIAFRGTDVNNPSPAQVNEHMALGWSNSGSGSLDAFEFSNFNNTNPPGYPPAHFVMMQSGAVDPTGGVVIKCNMTAGSAVLTSCAAPVPAAVGTLYVEGYGILDNTQIASGGGTTSPTLTQAVTSTFTPGSVRFWTPTSAQRQFFSAERDNQVYFNNFDGSQAIVINRASSQNQVGLYGGQLGSTRQLTGSTTSDTATVHDHFILWNATATSAKTQNIPGCTTTAQVNAGAISTAGQSLMIADEAGNAGTYAINVIPASGQINFGSSASINQNDGVMNLVCDGQANWVVSYPLAVDGTATITGGSINNTPIGQTTPTAGAFTSLAGTGLTVAANAPVSALNDTAASTGATLRWQLNGSNRWEWKNYGTDSSMNLGRFVAGTYTDNPISISNSSGLVTLPDGLSANSSSNAITGGAINNASVGATTASTGAFTTLSSTGNFTPSQTNGIVGTTTNNNANAGSVGEYVTATNSAGTAITTAVAANITSISLTAGDWDVSGVGVVTGSTTNLGNALVGIGTTSATVPGLGQYSQLQEVAATMQTVALPPPTTRISVASTTTVYLIGLGTFTTGTASVAGFLRARRIR